MLPLDTLHIQPRIPVNLGYNSLITFGFARSQSKGTHPLNFLPLLVGRPIKV